MLCPDTLPADDRDCQFLTCHTDLDNRRWPPSANHKHFFRIRPVFFDGSRYFLGCLNGIRGAGVLREEERDGLTVRPGDCDSPQRLLTIRDGGLIGTPDAIVTIRTQSRRSFSRSATEQEQVCLQAFQLFDSSLSRKSFRNRSLFSDPTRACGSSR